MADIRSNTNWKHSNNIGRHWNRTRQMLFVVSDTPRCRSKHFAGIQRFHAFRCFAMVIHDFECSSMRPNALRWCAMFFYGLQWASLLYVDSHGVALAYKVLFATSFLPNSIIRNVFQLLPMRFNGVQCFSMVFNADHAFWWLSMLYLSALYQTSYAFLGVSQSSQCFSRLS